MAPSASRSGSAASGPFTTRRPHGAPETTAPRRGPLPARAPFSYRVIPGGADIRTLVEHHRMRIVRSRRHPRGREPGLPARPAARARRVPGDRRGRSPPPLVHGLHHCAGAADVAHRPGGRPAPRRRPSRRGAPRPRLTNVPSGREPDPGGAGAAGHPCRIDHLAGRGHRRRPSPAGALRALPVGFPLGRPSDATSQLRVVRELLRVVPADGVPLVIEMRRDGGSERAA